MEELAFEVTSEQSISVPTRRAKELMARGVRRIFCVLVKKGQMLEWSPKNERWEVMEKEAKIVDPVLVRAMPVGAVLGAASADNAVAEALLSKKIPSLVKALEKERKEGEKIGRKEGEKIGIKRGEEEAIQLVARRLLRFLHQSTGRKRLRLR